MDRRPNHKNKAAFSSDMPFVTFEALISSDVPS